MAVIVEHKKTHATYYMLGTGFGMSHAAKPHWFFGDMVSSEQEGQLAFVAVCDAWGSIGWLESDQLRVVEIDGHKLQEPGQE